MSTDDPPRYATIQAVLAEAVRQGATHRTADELDSPETEVMMEAVSGLGGIPLIVYRQRGGYWEGAHVSGSETAGWVLNEWRTSGARVSADEDRVFVANMVPITPEDLEGDVVH